jgi:prephenate dehydrogenase
MKIGIIGNGRFGYLVATTLKSRTNEIVKIYSRGQEQDNINFFSLNEVCSCDIIIPCVPISEFEKVVKTIASLLKPGSLIIDVCSVKVHPEKVLLENISDGIDILSTHPMFGPDSTQNGTTFKNLKFIFWKTRIQNEERFNKIFNFLKSLGLEMLEIAPDEHDRQAAYTHAFAFLIGKVGIKIDVRRNDISTKGFEGILYNQLAVENDTSQLFNDMMTFNPYTKQMRQKVSQSLIEIEHDLNSKLL